MSTNERPNLVYLTGLALNKRLLQELFQFVAQDPDYTKYLEELSDFLQSAGKGTLSDDQKQIRDQLEGANDVLGWISLGVAPIATATTVMSGLFLLSKWFLHAYEANRRGLQKETFAGQKFLDELSKSREILNHIDAYRPLDFFSLYLANPTDIRGAVALAAGNEELDRCYNLSWGFADEPFYKNRFIDSVILRFKPSLLNKLQGHPKVLGDRMSTFDDIQLILDCLHYVYFAHGMDTLTSRALAELSTKSQQNRGPTGGYLDVLQQMSDTTQNEFIKAMSNRSLFGIGLLSRCLAELVAQIYKAYEERSTTTSENPPRLTVYCDESDRVRCLFLRELLECAGSPELMKIVDSPEEADLSIQLIEFNDPLDHLSDFPEYNSAKSFAHFFRGDNGAAPDLDNLRLKVPVKLLLSLPLEKGTPSQKALLPSNLVGSWPSSAELNVICVGGVEHNRPLMRLVNRHRQTHRENRVFGFMDNIFDFTHRWQHNNDDSFENLFIMGVGQPVSAFNQVLLSRQDSTDGLKSVSREAKLLYFEIDCPHLNQTVNVVSVYGFSAVSSMLATLYSIANIKEACTSRNDLTFSLAAHATSYPDDVVSRGTTIFLRFKADSETHLLDLAGGLDAFSFVRQDADGKLLSYIRTLENRGGAVEERRTGRIHATHQP
ncbi:MAG: hypothetical protein AB2723_04870 [Candidatus Thiodiazotropha sp.]